ncbi:MAG: UDP-N-acetylmuramoyl-tripeptide--D-alanyl-D-alanine ligase [Nitrosomonadales bacterium]|nr:UDP-N-acetylmuramoyl-tripeptide--D-alanyl-D-alanine ligase [Nitrosomonadales bacterium]
MMLLSQAAQALDARHDGADVRFSAVSTDTRTIAAGDLFVALRGENFDGAKFVAQAVQAGAVAAVVNADSKVEAAGCPLLRVADTRVALGNLAAYWRTRFDIPLVAITGSNGKTTVKEMLAAILRQKIKDDLRDGSPSPREGVGEREHSEDADGFVLATKGNFNNDIGMPLTLLRMNATHRYAVIEMGMNHPGEIDYLTRLARPDVALVNNATGAHLQGLGSVEGVARAKGEIFAGLKSDGTAVINADDAHAALWRELAGQHRVLDFALEREAAVKGEWVAQGYGGTLLIHSPFCGLKVTLQVPGEHNARNALAAATAALTLQVSPEAIINGLEAFGGVAGRLQRKKALHGALLIDDTYNANPASMHAALEVLAQTKGKRIFVLGDMGELGDDAAQFHREIGIAARELGIEQVFALGALSKGAVQEFGAAAKHFDSIEELCAVLDKEMDAQTTVLVKGSRFMKMERVVQFCALYKEETCCSH